MIRVYANLLGTWTDITKGGTVQDYQDPVTFFMENLAIDSRTGIAKAFEGWQVNVQYGGLNYRIDPACIQIVYD